LRGNSPFSRRECENLDADDPRLLVVVGPCSIHDTRAAREYAVLLKGTIKEIGRELRLVDAPVF
jgi:3-deoxy-7-phosphoheptulonate synthase